MRVVRSDSAAGKKLIAALINRGDNGNRSPQLEAAVPKIIADVRKSGDIALRKYSEKWDGFSKKQELRVSQLEMDSALKSLQSEQPETVVALKTAAKNIRTFCQWQKPKEWMRTIRPGVRVGQVVRPLQRVGCYVPGGRYTLPSTLLMTVIPAQVASVPEITVVSPKPARETLAT